MVIFNSYVNLPEGTPGIALGGRSGASSSGGSAARGGNTGRPGRVNIEDPTGTTDFGQCFSSPYRIIYIYIIYTYIYT